MTIVKDRSIIETINLVQTEINKTGFSKDLKNKDQGFLYRGIDNLYNLTAPIFAKYGLVILPKTYDTNTIEAGKTQKGNPIYHTRVHIRYEFRHIHNDQMVESTFPGEALDYSDKSTNKATTSAFKYMMIQTFNMPIVGVENDSDSETPDQYKEEQKTNVEKKSSNKLPTKQPTFDEIIELYKQYKSSLPNNWVDATEKHIENKDMKKLQQVYTAIKERVESEEKNE